MALKFNSSGELAVVLKVKDDGSVVLERFGKEAEQAGKRAKKGGDDASAGWKKTQATLKDLRTEALKVAAAVTAATAAVGVIGNNFVSAASEAEQYRVRLKVLLGSVEEGNRLFKEMGTIAGQVPFEYRDIMASATQLAGVLKGGVDEISRWMPLIADLAATSGLSIQDTTDQVIRMYSAGAASADLFRERGILAMLGFQAGVSYSAAETEKKLLKAWESPTSKIRGATDELAKTWDGMLSMISDKWFQFRNQVMDAGLFNYFKAIIRVVDQDLGRAISGNSGQTKQWAENIISIIETTALGAARLADMLDKPIDVIQTALERIWDGFQNLPPWAQEIGIVGALMGGTKGKVLMASLAATVSGFKTTAEWWDAYSKGHIGFMEWLTADNEDAKAKLDELREKGIITAEGVKVSGKLWDHGEADTAENAVKDWLARVRREFNALEAPKLKPVPDSGGEKPVAQAGELDLDAIYGSGFMKALQQRRDALLQETLTEQEILTRSYEDQQLQAEELFQYELITDQQRKAILEQLEIEHQAKLGDIHAQGLIERQRFSQMTTTQQTNYVLGEMIRLTQGAASSNRQMFEINKIAGIASATVDMFTGIEKTRSAYPYPLNIAMVALHLASSLANIAQLKKTKFGSATSAPTQAGGSAIPVIPASTPATTQGVAVPPTPEDTTARPVANINITVKRGTLLDSEWVREDLSPLLEEASKDGALNLTLSYV